MGEQPISLAGRVEPGRVPAAGGLRVRGLALQLHRYRRQPANCAGTDGQHRRLQAGLHRRLLRPLPDAAAGRGRAAAWCDQHGAGLGRQDRRPGAGQPRAGRDPLHRLHRGLPVACGGRSARTSTATAAIPASWARPAARTTSSLHPSGDPDAAATAVVRGGFEYQGQKCSAASRVYVPSNLWPRVRELLAEQVSSIPVGDVGRFPQLHGRGHRPQFVRHAGRGDREGQDQLRRRGAGGRVGATTPRDGSSRRRW